MAFFLVKNLGRLGIGMELTYACHHVHHILHHIHARGQGAGPSPKKGQPTNVFPIEAGNAGAHRQVGFWQGIGQKGGFHIGANPILDPLAVHHLLTDHLPAFRPLDVLFCNMPNAGGQYILLLYHRRKGQRCGNSTFTLQVQSIDIRGWIRLCVSHLLRLCQHPFKRRPVFMHVAQDKVGGAVDAAGDLLDFIQSFGP